MNVKAIAIIVLTLLSFSAPIMAAEPYSDAADAMDASDYATVLRIMHPLADQGDVAAQTSLGYLYANGKGVLQDFTEAAKWYRLAADRGGAVAQLGLGDMYMEGQGMPQNYVEAVKLYRLAATQGLE